MALDLEVGDRVVISTRTNDSIGIVTEITKGGNIRVGNILYNSDGRIRGGDRWSYNFITKATEEDIKKYERNKL